MVNIRCSFLAHTDLMISWVRWIQIILFSKLSRQEEADERRIDNMLKAAHRQIHVRLVPLGSMLYFGTIASQM